MLPRFFLLYLRIDIVACFVGHWRGGYPSGVYLLEWRVDVSSRAQAHFDCPLRILIRSSDFSGWGHWSMMCNHDGPEGGQYETSLTLFLSNLQLKAHNLKEMLLLMTYKRC